MVGSVVTVLYVDDLNCIILKVTSRTYFNMNLQHHPMAGRVLPSRSRITDDRLALAGLVLSEATVLAVLGEVRRTDVAEIAA